MFLDNFKIKNTTIKTKQENSTSEVENYIIELFTSKNSSPLKPNYGSDLLKNIGDYFNGPKIRYYIKNETTLMNKYNIVDVSIQNIEQTGNILLMELYITTLKGSHNVNIDATWENINFTNQDIFE